VTQLDDVRSTSAAVTLPRGCERRASNSRCMPAARRRQHHPTERWAEDRSGPLQAVRDAFAPRPTHQDQSWSEPADARAGDLTPESARLLLHEAEALFAARRDQALRAESRATTLQASAGVAVGLALTGAAFLIDPTKVADRPWRLALTVVLALMLCCLGMAGYLANRASAKLLNYWQPSPSQIVRRASEPEPQSSRDRALSLLECYAGNYYFVRFKIKHVAVAGLWFRAALACFAALSILLMLYTACGPLPR
jgi:hypothetical protein